MFSRAFLCVVILTRGRIRLRRQASQMPGPLCHHEPLFEAHRHQGVRLAIGTHYQQGHATMPIALLACLLPPLVDRDLRVALALDREALDDNVMALQLCQVPGALRREPQLADRVDHLALEPGALVPALRSHQSLLKKSSGVTP
jgi:hypothetical protein